MSDRTMFNLRLLLASAMLVVLAGATSATAQSSASLEPSSNLSPAVKALAKRGGPEKIDVIVTYREMPDAAEEARGKKLGADTKRAYGRLPMRALSVPAGRLNALANSANVVSVTVDSSVKSFSKSNRKTAKVPEQGSP